LKLLFDRYGNDAFRLAYSYLGSRQDAEDVCQSVFVNLATRSAKLIQGKEKSLLLTCVANACKNHLRSFWRRNVQPLDESVPFHTQQDSELHDAVMRLPSGYRVVIHLYYFEGYDQGQISSILGISRTAVQTRMSRAREMLKKELSEID